jgi:hypothetical protein
MIRTRYATDAAVAATVAISVVAPTPGGTTVTSTGATDLDVFAALVVTDIGNIKTEIAALRVKLGV